MPVLQGRTFQILVQASLRHQTEATLRAWLQSWAETSDRQRQLQHLFPAGLSFYKMEQGGWQGLYIQSPTQETPRGVGDIMVELSEEELAQLLDWTKRLNAGQAQRLGEETFRRWWRQASPAGRAYLLKRADRQKRKTLLRWSGKNKKMAEDRREE